MFFAYTKKINVYIKYMSIKMANISLFWMKKVSFS